MSDRTPRTWRTWQLLLAAGAALILGLAVGGAASAPKDETIKAAATTTTILVVKPFVSPPTRAPTTAAPTTEPPPTTVPGPKTSFGDGSYRVGVDIAPGTYHSSGTATDCYWKRLSNFTGNDNIIANYLSNSPTTVTILAGDAGFETRRCGTWTKT